MLTSATLPRMKKTFLTDQTDDATWYMQACIDSHEMRCMSCGTQIKDSRSKLIKFQRFKSGLTTMTIWFFHAKIQDQKYRSSEFSRYGIWLKLVFFSIQECSYLMCPDRTLTARVRLKVKLALTRPRALPKILHCNNLHRFGTVVLLLKGWDRESAVRACTYQVSAFLSHLHIDYLGYYSSFSWCQNKALDMVDHQTISGC